MRALEPGHNVNRCILKRHLVKIDLQVFDIAEPFEAGFQTVAEKGVERRRILHVELRVIGEVARKNLGKISTPGFQLEQRVVRLQTDEFDHCRRMAHGIAFDIGVRSRIIDDGGVEARSVRTHRFGNGRHWHIDRREPGLRLGRRTGRGQQQHGRTCHQS